MATRTISAAGGNYDAVGTWDEGVVPTNLDDVVVRADGTSGSVVVTAAAAAKTINLTAGAYNGTITINSTFTLSVSGSVTMNTSGTCPGIGVGGTGTLSFAVSGTLTSNGKTLNCNLQWQITSGTLTLADDANVTGQLAMGGGSTPVISSANKTMVVAGGTSFGSRARLTATTLRVTGGTHTCTIPNNSYGLQGTGTFEFDGNVTINDLYLRTSIVKYTSGTWSFTGARSLNMGGTQTLMGSPPLERFNFRNSGTLTLDSPLNPVTWINSVASTLTFAGGQAVSTAQIRGTNPASIIDCGDCTFTVDNIYVDADDELSLRGALSLSVNAVAIQVNAKLFYQDGQVLTVVNSFVAGGDPLTLSQVRARTPGNTFTLALGPATLVQSSFMDYNDVVVTGRIIANAFGGTLTNTSGIVNKDTNASMHGTDPGVASTLYGVGYVINGAALTGAFVPKISSGA